jgi:hypothetical protein
MSRSAYLILGVVVIVGVATAARALFFARNRAAQSGPTIEISQDYRNRKLPTNPWKIFGRETGDLIRAEEGGLRIALPTGRIQDPPHVGCVYSGGSVSGDFDISCGYEVIQIEKPTTGWGVGFEVFIMTDTPTNEAISLERMTRANGDDVFHCSRNTSLRGKREFQTRQFPAAGSAGRLRLTRTGTEVTAWVKEPTGGYSELHRMDLGAEDLKMVRFAAHPGIANNAVDVRITDVKIASKSD